MKMLLVLFCICFGDYSCIGAKYQQHKEDKVTLITVYVSPFQLQTDASITCDDFLNAIPSLIDTIRITDKEIQNEILKPIMKSVKAQKEVNIDTRAQILILYSSGKSDTLCLQRNEYYLYNGTTMIMQDKNLIYYLSHFKKKNRP